MLNYIFEIWRCQSSIQCRLFYTFLTTLRTGKVGSLWADVSPAIWWLSLFQLAVLSRPAIAVIQAFWWPVCVVALLFFWGGGGSVSVGDLSELSKVSTFKYSQKRWKKQVLTCSTNFSFALRTDRKTKIAALDVDLLMYVWLLVCNRRAKFDQTWQKASTFPGLCFRADRKTDDIHSL